jgi:hypothetical protein
MKRIVISGLAAGLVAMSLGVSGCGGSGGLSEGIPSDVKSLPTPAQMPSNMGPPPKNTSPGKVGARTGGWRAPGHA